MALFNGEQFLPSSLGLLGQPSSSNVQDDAGLRQSPSTTSVPSMPAAQQAEGVPEVLQFRAVTIAEQLNMTSGACLCINEKYGQQVYLLQPRYGEFSVSQVFWQLEDAGYSLVTLNGMLAEEILSRHTIPLPESGIAEMDITPNSIRTRVYDARLTCAALWRQGWPPIRTLLAEAAIWPAMCVCFESICRLWSASGYQQVPDEPVS